MYVQMITPNRNGIFPAFMTSILVSSFTIVKSNANLLFALLGIILSTPSLALSSTSNYRAYVDSSRIMKKLIMRRPIIIFHCIP